MNGQYELNRVTVQQKEVKIAEKFQCVSFRVFQAFYTPGCPSARSENIGVSYGIMDIHR